MRHVLIIPLLLLTLSGCTNGVTVPPSTSVTVAVSAATIKIRAGQAGQIAGSGFIILSRPTPAEVAAVRTVVKLVATNLNKYQTGGFSNDSAGVGSAIDTAFPASSPYVPIAHALASTMLFELDSLFDSHPDWQAQGVDIAGIVAAFCNGVDGSLASYVVKGYPMHKSYSIQANVYQWSDAATKSLPAPEHTCKNGLCH